MNFVLPQFIDMETKIVGPFTLKQFVYVGIGTAISFMLYMISSANQKSFPLVVCIAIIVIIEGIAFSLAFIKVNGISLPVIIKNSVRFAWAPKIYIWKKFSPPRMINPSQQTVKIEKTPGKKVNLVAKSNLKNLRNFMETKSN